MSESVPIALGAYQVVSNVMKGEQAKKEAAALAKSRPIRTTSQFDKDNLSLSESELATGQSAKGEKAYNDATDRGLSTSISEMLKAGGNPNDIGSIYTNSEQGRQQLAVIQDQLRLAQIQNVLKQNENMASEDQNNWLVNEYGPYKDKLKAIGEARKNAAEGITKGIDTLGGGVMGLTASKLPTTTTPTNVNDYLASSAMTSNVGEKTQTGDSPHLGAGLSEDPNLMFSDIWNQFK